MERIDCLVVDDEKDLTDSIVEYFGAFGIKCNSAYDIASAKNLLTRASYRMVLLDLNLPDGTGYELCKELRKSHTNVKVFFISARSKDEDIIRAYGAGGDDYITKPFSLNVLLAKVSSRLNRMNTPSAISLNNEAMTVIVEENEVELKPMEFKLLKYLVDNANIVLAKEKIFEEVWQGIFSENTLNVHIKRLRDKIEQNPNNPTRIVTVWGVGYKYNDKA